LRPFPAAHRLGLTATAERKDGLTHVLHWLMGPTVFCIQRRPGVATTTSVPAVLQLMHQPRWKEIRTAKGQILFTKMITKMVEDARRNDMIAKTLVALCKERRKMLVVSDRRKHLTVLQAMLPTPVSSAMYVGETTKKGKRKREEEKDKVDILFTTYQMGEEGLDLPFLDTLVMVTPRKSLDQIIGRILRKKDGKQDPLIVDVVDTLSIFYGMARGRMRYYRDKKYVVKKTIK
jgi:superfamily II DNA or RNA helicase